MPLHHGFDLLPLYNGSVYTYTYIYRLDSILSGEDQRITYVHITLHDQVNSIYCKDARIAGGLGCTLLI